MTPSDRRLYESALRLRNSPEFSDFRDWLARERERHLNMVRGTPPAEKMYAAVGAMNAIERVVALIEEAPGLLEKTAPKGN